MIINKIDKENIRDTDLDLIVGFLAKNKIVVLPTDTIYGLHARADSKIAIKKMGEIKKRPQSKPFLILVSSITMLKKYCYVNNIQLEQLKKIWDKTNKRAITIILKNKKIIYENKKTIAVRLPNNTLLLKIIRKLNNPLISTSLNISGKLNINNLDDIEKYFKNEKPDLVINAGKLAKNRVSKIIDLTCENIRIIRK